MKKQFIIAKRFIFHVSKTILVPKNDMFMTFTLLKNDSQTSKAYACSSVKTEICVQSLKNALYEALGPCWSHPAWKVSMCHSLETYFYLFCMQLRLSREACGCRQSATISARFSVPKSWPIELSSQLARKKISIFCWSIPRLELLIFVLSFSDIIFKP